MAGETTDGKQSRLVHERASTLDTKIHIQQGTALKLRNIRSLVSNQRMYETRIVRPVVQWLGMNTTNMLKTAAE